MHIILFAITRDDSFEISKHEKTKNKNENQKTCKLPDHPLVSLSMDLAKR